MFSEDRGGFRPGVCDRRGVVRRRGIIAVMMAMVDGISRLIGTGALCCELDVIDRKGTGTYRDDWISGWQSFSGKLLITKSLAECYCSFHVIRMVLFRNGSFALDVKWWKTFDVFPLLKVVSV